MIGGISFVLQQFVCLPCRFTICNVQVMKIHSSPIMRSQGCYVTKVYVFLINFVTILMSSLIYDARYLSLSSLKNVMKSQVFSQQQVLIISLYEGPYWMRGWLWTQYILEPFFFCCWWPLNIWWCWPGTWHMTLILLICCIVYLLLPLFLIIGRLTFFTSNLTIRLIQKLVQNINFFVVAYFINTSSSIMS